MRRLLLIFHVASLSVLSPCVFAQSNVSAPARASQARVGERVRLSGLPNFGKINEYLYRGAQPRETGIAELQRLGINTIVDLRAEDPGRAKWEKKRSESIGMRFVHIPVDGWSPPTDAQVVEFLSIFRESPQEKVFVHCRFGDDRTGVFVAAYRMVFDRFLSDEALHEMYVFGFNGFWHPSMATFVHEFPKHLSTDPRLAPFKPAD